MRLTFMGGQPGEAQHYFLSRRRHASADTFTMTFDELGNCTSTLGACSGGLALDPTKKVTGNVLIFTLPQLTYTGDTNIYEPDGVTLSDHLRWISAANYSVPNSLSLIHI